MSGDKLLVLATAGGVIGLIYWFFLGKRNEDGGKVVTVAEIKVAGGYSPALVKVPAGKQVRLTFLRTDPTDCLEELVFPDLKIKRTLPMNTPVEILMNIDKSGEYPWHCGMNMYHGKLIAV